MPRVLVACHAHPDDEAVLTGGTLARAAAQGHRVVLALATDGGLSRPDASAADELRMGARRMTETLASARALGVARVAYLGYADSGPGPAAVPAPPGRTRFTDAPLDEAAHRLATVLRREQADVLLGYDRNGGYGHPDHVRVHEVAVEAARLAGTPRLLHATAPRVAAAPARSFPSRFRRRSAATPESGRTNAFSARGDITHRISVFRYAARKRAALRAHASQTAPCTGSDRLLAAVLLLPRPLYAVIAGREWYIDPAHRGPISRDIFADLP